ncbi:MAG: DUF1592 domain-containing protein [Polyangiales bacterium]
MIRLLCICALLVAACEGDIGDRDPNATPAPGPHTMVEKCPTCVGVSPLARLTRAEYEGTIRQVFGEDSLSAFDFDRLPGDGRVGPFTSNAELLVDDASVQAYRDVAERAADSLAADAACEDRTCATLFIARVGEGLFRQPLSDEEQEAYEALLDIDADVTTGVRLAVTALLQSPRFLYRVELGTGEIVPGTVELSGRELATRLAFLFTRESPDEALLAAADDGRLDTTEGIRAEAERLFAHPNADRMIIDFHHGWLGLDALQQRTPDPAAHPEFAALQEDILAETHAFVLANMRGDASFSELFLANYTYASDELAAYYGSEPGMMSDASDLPRVELNGDERSGLLTQAGVISAHTVEDSTAGVHRGKFIRENFLCLSLPAPPPVDAIVAPDPTLSTRQRFEAKTGVDGCRNCHVLLNPTGFLLEHYDLTGAYRDMDGEFPIDASGGLPGSDVDGPLDGALELSQALATSEMAQRCMVRQWFRYTMGRTDGTEDATAIEETFEAFQGSDYNLRELVITLTTTSAFRLRQAPEGE